MIGLDTNVIVAWMVEGQRLKLPASATYRISHIAVSELVWVLTNRFSFSKEAVGAVLDRLLAAKNVVVDRPEVVKGAADAFLKSGVDFPDAMIARDNEAAGCRETLTLDRGAARKPGFTLVGT
jgi:predicted nucleic-acid-binding protein